MLDDMAFTTFMPDAIEEARAAAARGEVPVGAVLVSPDGTVLARAGNETRAGRDPTAHAEVLAIRRACARLGAERLTGCTLWVTLEPCPMCAAAIAHARIARLVYGASDPKSGGIETGPRLYAHPNLHHAPEIVAGIDETTCRTLLTEFFGRKRDPQDRDRS